MPADDTVDGRATREIAQWFGRNTREARGTYEGAAIMQGNEDREAVQNDGGYSLRRVRLTSQSIVCAALLGGSMHPGIKSVHPVTVPRELHNQLLQSYNDPTCAVRTVASPAQIYHRYDPGAPHNSVFLDTVAHTLKYIVMNGRRITPGMSSAIVKVLLPGRGSDFAGDVLQFFHHTQTGFATPQVFAEMSWMVSRQSMNVAGDPWNELCAAVPNLVARSCRTNFVKP